jgi:uncharacterized protein (TIGR00106 family)
MAMLEISVVPVGTSTPSVSHFVAEAVKTLKNTRGIKYELTPMGTVIEGELDVLLDCARKMHRAAFGPEVKRVVTTIKIDDRLDKPLTMAEKISSVWRKL